MRNKVVFVTTVAVSARGFLTEHIRRMNPDDWDIYVMCQDDGNMESWAKHSDCRFVHIPMKREPDVMSDFVSLLLLVFALRRIRPDLVVVGTPKAGLLGAVASWICRIRRRVYVLHGLRFETAIGIKRWALILFERVACRLCSSVVAVSESIQRCATDVGLPAEKITVLGSGSIAGVDSTYFVPKSLSASGNLNPARTYLFIGRICGDKGLHVLAGIAGLIGSSELGERLVIVGPDESSERDSGLVEEMRSNPQVDLIGSVDDVRPFLDCASVVVLPSKREGLPISLIEAGCMGVPVVASRVTGCVDVVITDNIGTLVDVESAPDVWLRAIRNCSERSFDGSLRHRIRAETLDRFGQDIVCANWIDYYRCQVVH